MKELICLSVFFLLSLFFAILMIVTGFIFQYKNTTHLKEEAYECGIKAFSNELNYSIHYFHYAIVFLIFDIETVLLYPIALILEGLKTFLVVETFIFVSILLFGLYFIVKKKFLRWL